METTGTNPRSDRVIEVGIVRIENNEVVGQLNTLINPQGAYISPYISEMTGITAAELSAAPYFDEVKSDVVDLLADSVFVAHNVNFDYGFIKHELARLEAKFKAKTLCTVRLSRYLYPQFRKHNLDALNERFSLNITNRHRAFDDALALWDFYRKAQEVHKKEDFIAAIKAQLDYSIPKNLKKADIDNLPETPGVYIFWGQQGEDEIVLYVGKSVNVKKRVMNHFSSAKFSKKEDRMFNEITRVEVIKTAGELGALIRESDLVKKLSPVFNAVLRRKTEMLALVRDEKDGYFTAKLELLESLNDKNMGKILGIYRSKKNAQTQLREFAKEYKLCPILLGLEKGKGRCFNSQLELCNGACVGKENALKYNLRFIEAFSSTLVPNWPFESEVLIKEEGDEGTEIHKINNWIYKGSVLYDEVGNENSGLTEAVFDWDVYKIIKRAVRRNKVIIGENRLGQQDLFDPTI